MDRVSKRIRGKLHSQAEFRERVVEAIRRAGGEGSTQTVVDDWGDPLWGIGDNRRMLSNLMAKMGACLTKVEGKRGVYRLNEKRYAAHGTRISGGTERVILEAVEELGGVAKWSRIARHLGIEDDTDYETSRKALARLLKRGELDAFTPAREKLHNRKVHYCLPDDKLKRIPLTGQNFERLFIYRCIGKLDDWESVLEWHLERVGLVVTYALLMTARTDDDAEAAEAALAHPGITAALNEALREFMRTSSYRTRVLAIQERISRLVEGDDDEGERSRTDLSFNERLQRLHVEAQALEDDALRLFLRAFMDGDAETHRIAPLALYHALGELTGEDPAPLSRGVWSDRIAGYVATVHGHEHDSEWLDRYAATFSDSEPDDDELPF